MKNVMKWCLGLFFSTLAVAVEPTITVELVLLEKPSTVSNVIDMRSLGVPIENPSHLVPGTKVYLEAWCQDSGKNGITSAILDIAYPTEFFATSVERVDRDPQWNMLAYEHFVDSEAGIVDNVGGNNLANWRRGDKWLGISPEWARIATVAFEVVGTPTGPISFCSFPAWHYSLPENARTARFITFAVKGVGLEKNVKYGCAAVGCNVDTECDDGNPCTDNVCRSGVCDSAYNSVPCSDGLFCTAVDVCLDGGCVGSGSPCKAGEFCDDENDRCEASGETCTVISTKRVSIGTDLFLTLTVNACYEE